MQVLIGNIHTYFNGLNYSVFLVTATCPLATEGRSLRGDKTTLYACVLCEQKREKINYRLILQVEAGLMK